MNLTCDDVRELAAGYVLGALSAEEQAAVRSHLQACPEAHDEVNQLGAVVPHLAESVEPVEPPPALRRRLLEAAAAEADRSSRAAGSDVRPWAVELSSSKAQARASRPPTWVWLTAAVAALAIVALGGLASVLQRDLQTARDYENAIAAVVDVAAQEGSQLAILSGDPNGPRGLAAVGADGRVVIAMRDLAPTQGSDVYEAWVIAGDAPPVPIGSFAVDQAATGTLYAVYPAPVDGLVLALSLEPGPGATQPTGPIVVTGAAAPPPS